jgi:type IV secretion system protein VirB6
VADSTVRLAGLLEPVIVSLGVLYVIVWGYLHMTGKIDEPVLAGTKRILTLGVILGAALKLWAYNEVIVDTFFVAPSSLAAQMIGAFDEAEIVDAIFDDGFEVATMLVSRGSIFDDNLIFYMAGASVYLAVLLTGLYTMFLLILSRIALSILLALGPLFIALLLFDTTKKFFESWLAQLANYALITLLTVLVAALMMTFVSRAAQQAMQLGGDIEVVQALRLVMAAGLTLLVMRQVMSMAAGLASGLALSTFGVVSSALRWGLGSSTRGVGQFGRGLFDRQTTRWDPLARKAGYLVGRGTAASMRVARSWRENSIRRS